MTADGVAPSLLDLYHIHPNRLRRCLDKGRPVVAVVMKHADHLIRFGESLRSALDHTLPNLGRPIHMLVIDDEADDGSILDAAVEAGLEPGSDALKQMPRHIARLWSERGSYHTTFGPALYATYVAYTATPQANILQSDHNPLSPSHFVVALRTPGDRGSVVPPRITTFAEPQGLSRYYCGGERFYGLPTDAAPPLCIPLTPPLRTDFTTDDEFREATRSFNVDRLGDALRAFFVAAAVRTLNSGKSLIALRSLESATLDEVMTQSPPPTCMLVHPSGAIGDQARVAEMLSEWCRGPAADQASSDYWRAADGRPLSASGLVDRLNAEEPLWRQWHDSHQASRDSLAHRHSGSGLEGIGDATWEVIRRTLIHEVFPTVRLRIINSDPSSDDRPRFEPERLAGPDGHYIAAPDLLTVFVSGNVMSRGITLEGLTTTVFVRSTDSPAADTQTQMQRWFGYRGRHLHLCRVFLYEDQLDLFRAYYENDEALKAEVLSDMNSDSGHSPSPLVLQGARFRATAKIANLQALPLCPGRVPFVRVLETGEWRDNNIQVLSQMLDKPGWSDLKVGGVRRGRILEQPLGMIQIAELLEKLRYAHHDPDPRGRHNDRWRAIAGEIGLTASDSPLFRPPGLQSPLEAVPPTSCPYSIAAYLRLWRAALRHRARGLFPTDDYRTPWSMINLTQYAADAPHFYLGVRYGSAGVAHHPALSGHG